MKKYFREMKCLMRFAFALAVFLSCSKTKGGSPLTEAGGSAETVVYNPPLVFEDYGRTVTVKQKPQKVLTLGSNCYE